MAVAGLAVERRGHVVEHRVRSRRALVRSHFAADTVGTRQTHARDIDLGHVVRVHQADRHDAVAARVERVRARARLDVQTEGAVYAQ